jgi:ABC-type glycerol-3-phosphate transport system substrate-binding protein
MLKRKLWLGLALGLLGLTSLSMSVMAQDAPPAEPTAIVSDLGTGELKLSFWNGLTGSDGTTLNAMLEAYIAENPEVSLTTEIIPWGTLYTKLQAAFVAGQPPDLFVLHASEIPQFHSYGALMDLSSWYTSGGGTLPDEDFAQPGFGGVFVDGVPMAFRWTIMVVAHGSTPISLKPLVLTPKFSLRITKNSSRC